MIVNFRPIITLICENEKLKLRNILRPTNIPFFGDLNLLQASDLTASGHNFLVGSAIGDEVTLQIYYESKCPASKGNSFIWVVQACIMKTNLRWQSPEIIDIFGTLRYNNNLHMESAAL